MMESEYNLRLLKEDYREIQEKYDLPSFKELNEDFGIEKISELKFEILIREVRKYISDRLSNCERFIETILNPSNVPMFFYSFIKSLGESEKKKLKEIYKVLAKKSLDIIELDLHFSESKESEFIKNSFKTWQEIKMELLSIVSNVKENWDNEPESKSKDYFG